MDDNFQILNLTENPFPQNPIIIIDENDKRINGLIHYAKILSALDFPTKIANATRI